MRVMRLGVGDRDLAGRTFALMADVFEEEGAPLAEAYLDRLLASPSFWALAAVDGDTVVGGVTAHALPMTRAHGSELFIYDLAVEPAHQRRGVGRALIAELRRLGAEAGIPDAFVPADDDDTHALDFYRAIGGAPAPVTMFTFGAP